MVFSTEYHTSSYTYAISPNILGAEIRTSDGRRPLTCPVLSISGSGLALHLSGIQVALGIALMAEAEEHDNQDFARLGDEACRT